MKRTIVCLLLCGFVWYANAQPRIFTTEDRDSLVSATLSIVDESIVYDPAYMRISYPMGDVPAHKGVCVDVVIRAFRKGLHWDLQESVCKYRKSIGASIDTNIDHRRVRNLIPYFDGIMAKKKNAAAYKGDDIYDFEAGDVLVWDLGGGILHIGIAISDEQCVHNICCGQEISYIGSVYGNVIRRYRLW